MGVESSGVHPLCLVEASPFLKKGTQPSIWVPSLRPNAFPPPRACSEGRSLQTCRSHRADYEGPLLVVSSALVLIGGLAVELFPRL